MNQKEPVDPKDYKILELSNELKGALAIIDALVKQKTSFRNATEEAFLIRLRTGSRKEQHNE